MKNFIVAFSVFMMWAVLGMWYYSCVLKEVCEDDALTEQQVNEDRAPIADNVEAETTEAPENLDELQALIITDSLNVVDGDLNNILSYPLAPEIQINSPQVEIPQTSSIFISDVITYMQENPETHLIVYGAYDGNEFSSSQVDNHGLTRAAYIRDLLVEEGLNGGRTSIEALKADLDFVHDETFQGGILLQIINYNELDADDSEDISEESAYEKTLYTNFDQNEFRPSQEELEYAERLKSYLEENPSVRITITGHTDSVGEAEANEWIGMERAKSVRDFLLGQGIPDYKIQTATKGENEPVIDNSTRENRAKNRRIEIELN